jgi:hypothetical protein
MADPLKRPEQPAQAPQHTPLNAPLFRTLLERLGEDRRAIVLDLGSARTETIALFGRFRCRLDIADLTAGLARLGEDAAPDELRAATEALLPAPRQEPADVVLCWDLLNYLTRPALEAVMACVAARAQPGTLVHALIAYAATRMPTRPNRIVALDDQHLSFTPVTAETRPAPRYTPEDLTGCMPDYEMVRGMLLRNGMQEFLFRL